MSSISKYEEGRLFKAGIKSGDMMKKHYNRIRQSASGGFTLVELMVVLMVLMILCGIAVSGIISWMDYSTMRRRNEQASTIYLAAQTMLTQYEQRGQLTAFGQLITGSEEESAPEESYQVPDEVSAGAGRMYLKAGMGDYGRYQTFKSLSDEDIEILSSEDRQLKALFDLIDPYITDKEMLSRAAVCIELDPSPRKAVIYGVFYMDGKDGQDLEFVYSDTVSEDSGEVSMIKRDYESRRKILLGYYGSDR